MMMPDALKLDRIDIRILSQLQRNGRVTNVDLADAVGLSPSPCLIRVKRLEKAGFIVVYGAHVQLEKLGTMQLVFTQVTAAPTFERISIVNTSTLRRYLRVMTFTTGGFTSCTFACMVVKNEIAGTVF